MFLLKIPKTHLEDSAESVKRRKGTFGFQALQNGEVFAA